MKPCERGAMPLEPEQAREMARELCASALAWGKTLYACVASLDRTPVPRGGAVEQHAEVAEELFEEMLAYGLCRLQMRVERSHGAGGKEWLVLVKQECEALKEGRTWKRRHQRKRLGAPAPSRSTSFAEGFARAESTSPEARRLTKEMFEQFCRNTGLGSNVLVGKGENLAALVFYVALHGLWSAHQTLTSEQVRHLLQAAQQCRLQVDQCLARWFGPPQPSAEAKAFPSSTARGLKLPAHTGLSDGDSSSSSPS